MQVVGADDRPAVVVGIDFGDHLNATRSGVVDDSQRQGSLGERLGRNVLDDQTAAVDRLRAHHFKRSEQAAGRRHLTRIPPVQRDKRLVLPGKSLRDGRLVVRDAVDHVSGNMADCERPMLEPLFEHLLEAIEVGRLRDRRRPGHRSARLRRNLHVVQDVSGEDGLVLRIEHRLPDGHRPHRDAVVRLRLPFQRRVPLLDLIDAQFQLHRRRHPVPQRQLLSERHGDVVMVHVQKPRRDDEPRRVDRLAAGDRIARDGGDHPILDADVPHRVQPRLRVHHSSVQNHQIEPVLCRQDCGF